MSGMSDCMSEHKLTKIRCYSQIDFQKLSEFDLNQFNDFIKAIENK